VKTVAGGNTKPGGVLRPFFRHQVSHQTVANVLKRHDIAPAPERRKTTNWREFIRAHLVVLAAVDFFTAEGLDGQRFDNLLCSDLYARGLSTGMHCGNYAWGGPSDGWPKWRGM
jgi:hypothetical protein